MKADKNEKTIVCRYGEFSTIELHVAIDKEVVAEDFVAMRRRLLRRERGVFFTEVIFQAETSILFVVVGACVKAQQLVLVFDIFRNEVEKLTNDSYCLDCSLLHQRPPRRKPTLKRKSKCKSK